MDIIDPHLHFFFPAMGKYHWLRPENPPFWSDKQDIATATDERDLPHSGPVRLAGYVHIEAGFDNARPWREIQLLQQYCRLPFKSIAGIDLPGADFATHLEALVQLPSVAGVRYILDEQAEALLAEPRVQHRLGMLADRDLLFEAQFPLENRGAVVRLCRVLERYPRLRVIVNHAGLPATNNSGLRRWRAAIHTLARFPNVAIKLSGWEMQNRYWSWPQVKNITCDVLSEFSIQQVMLASNSPLCRWRSDYRSLWTGYQSVIPPSLHSSLMRENAARWYGLPRTKV